MCVCVSILVLSCVKSVVYPLLPACVNNAWYRTLWADVAYLFAFTVICILSSTFPGFVLHTFCLAFVFCFLKQTKQKHNTLLFFYSEATLNHHSVLWSVANDHNLICEVFTNTIRFTASLTQWSLSNYVNGSNCGSGCNRIYYSRLGNSQVQAVLICPLC